MKIASWNVNGIRAIERKGELDRFLKAYKPDILLLQETKAKSDQLSAELTEHPEYEQFYHSAEKPGYAGTAIWIKKELLIPGSKNSQNPGLDFQTGMPNCNDDEGRISKIDIGAWSVLGIYFPNGGKSPEAWKGKLEFYEQFLSYVNILRSEGKKVIWAGDVNCAHQEIDLARPRENDGKIGFHPRERAWMNKVVDNGWVDTFRALHGDEIVYSWWDVVTRSRERNVGWRIDYFFIDKALLSHVKNIQYLTSQMGSDHCPVMIEIQS
ncbi:exodeoxyribonuclease III [Candidatus Gracilibacteria bacterium]|nr:exodeoxyribonuclease III [Candidatus Gracilibacteria bacterium]